MQKIESLPPTSLGSPEIDWSLLDPNQRMTTSFQIQDGGIEFKNDKELQLPKQLREIVEAIDEDFRDLNSLGTDSSVRHNLNLRAGYETSTSVLTSLLPQRFNIKPPKIQLPGLFHIDIPTEDEQIPMSYTASSREATEFMLGDFFVASDKVNPHSLGSIFGGLIGNYILLRVQKGLILQPNPGELVRFDPTSSVHRSPYRRLDGTGLDHIFLRDAVSIGHVPEGE